MFNLDYVKMIQNIAAQASMGGPIWTMVTGFCYFMGLVLLLVSARQMKEVAEKGQLGASAPLLSFIAAALLMTVPTAIASVGMAVFGNDMNVNPLAYDSGQVAASPIKAVLTVVQLIGYIFFVRGILELRRAGEPNRHQGASVNKAIIIMVSGMAAIYINYTLGTIGSVTGWNVDAILK